MPLVSKTDFAALVGVSKPLVSRWVRDGLLGEALVGEGRRAKIDVEIARRLLRDRLDADQRSGRNAKARLDEPGDGASIDAKIKVQKLRLATAQADRAEREKEVTTDAFVTRKEAMDAVFKVRDVFRGMLQVHASEIASEVCAEFPSVPKRLLAHKLWRASEAAWGRWKPDI